MSDQINIGVPSQMILLDARHLYTLLGNCVRHLRPRHGRLSYGLTSWSPGMISIVRYVKLVQD